MIITIINLISIYPHNIFKSLPRSYRVICYIFYSSICENQLCAILFIPVRSSSRESNFIPPPVLLEPDWMIDGIFVNPFILSPTLRCWFPITDNRNCNCCTRLFFGFYYNSTCNRIYTRTEVTTNLVIVTK